MLAQRGGQLRRVAEVKLEQAWLSKPSKLVLESCRQLIQVRRHRVQRDYEEGDGERERGVDEGLEARDVRASLSKSVRPAKWRSVVHARECRGARR